MIYKVSVVITGTEHGGAIINLSEMPSAGDHLQISEMEVEVVEVVDLMPPRGDFHFLHASCKLIKSG